VALHEMPLSPQFLEGFDVLVKALTPLSSNNTSAISIAWDPMGAWSKKQNWLLCFLQKIARAKSGCALPICVQRFSLQISS